RSDARQRLEDNLLLGRKRSAQHQRGGVKTALFQGAFCPHVIRQWSMLHAILTKEDLQQDPFLSSVPGPSWSATPGTPTCFRKAALVDDMRASAPGTVL